MHCLEKYRRYVVLLLLVSGRCFAQGGDISFLFDDPLSNRDAIIERVAEAEASYKKRLVVEPLLLDVLNGSGHSSEAKEFAGQQLFRICDEDTIDELVTLLYRRGTGDIARRGLEGIKHPAAEEALLDSLRKATGSTLAGVIESLGRLQVDEAVRPLRGFVQSGNTEVVRASLIALGEIGGEDAAELLGMSRLTVRRSLRDTATSSYIRSGWTSLERGDSEIALIVFDALLLDVEDIEIRQEALRGYVKVEGEYAIPLIVETLKNDVPAMQTAAIDEASRIPDIEATEALVESFSDLTSPIQVLVIQILGGRADSVGLPTAIQSINNRNPDVRLEALRSIAKFNHPDSIPVLLKTLATGDEQEREIADLTLRALEGERINGALVKSAMSADNAIRLEAVKMMPVRNAVQGGPTLVRIAERDIKQIQFEALKALGVLGTQNELELMVREWSGSWSNEERAEIGRGVIAIARRSPEGPKRVQPLHTALKGTSSAEVQLSIIRALAEIGEDASVDVLRSLLRRGAASVQSEIIGILLDWPSAEVLPELERLAKSSDDVAVRNEAYAGFVAKLAETTDHESSSTVRMYQRAVKLATTTEKRRLLLPGALKLTGSNADRVLSELAKDPEIADEIDAAGR
jgi:HEAT repeat protein